MKRIDPHDSFTYGIYRELWAEMDRVFYTRLHGKVAGNMYNEVHILAIALRNTTNERD